MDDAQLDARERWLDSVIGRYVGYVGLVIGYGLSPFVLDTTPRFWLVSTALAVASASWTYVFTTRQRAWPSGSRGTSSTWSACSP